MISKFNIKYFFNFIKQNKILFSFFLLGTFIFLYQHINVSWDFRAYILNARYLFYDGFYFETLRPPLVPLLLGFFMLFGKLAEFLYIIFVTCLFFYSSIKLSDIIFYNWIKKGFSKKSIRAVFYFFNLSSFVLVFGIQMGSELLSLAFFELFLYLLLSKKLSGHFLALAFLTRYSFFSFLPLLFFYKNFKKVIKNILLFLLIIFPWLLFNYLKFGNWFTSIVDAYANNVLFREHLFISINFLEIFSIISWFLPVFIMGVIYTLFSLFKSKKRWFHSNRFYLLFLYLFFIIVLNYINIPLKQIRYLFSLSLPIAYFSSMGYLFFVFKFKKIKKYMLNIIFILFIITSFFTYLHISDDSYNYNQFNRAAEDIDNLGIDECLILSPNWVMVDYYTDNIYALGRNKISDSLNRGEIVLIFYSESTIDDKFNKKELDKYSKLFETNEYVFLVDEEFDTDLCAKKYVYDSPYVYNHCEVISDRFKKIKMEEFILNICKFINKK